MTEQSPTLVKNQTHAVAIRTAQTSSNGHGFTNEQAYTLDGANGQAVAHTLRGEGFDASEDGTGRGTPLVPEIVGTLSDGAHSGGGLTAKTPTPGELSRCLNAGGQGRQDYETETLIPTGGFFDYAVRRLTPRECERLQGFPDDYTLVPHNGKPAADGPRYKSLGNSMATPVMLWLGKRIEHVETALAVEFPVLGCQDTARGVKVAGFKPSERDGGV